MRQLYFLLPGTSQQFACGGLWAELKILDLAQQICEAQVVTYRKREPNTLFLPDILQQPQSLKDSIFVLSWGFDVPKLAAQLKQQHLIYHAHSTGYGFNLPSQVPIITVSRNSLGYWGQRSPHSLLYYLPNQIGDEFYNQQRPRDLDVLVHARKSSRYLMQELVPALQEQCRVEVVSHFVKDLATLFNRTQIYLYDSAEYWAIENVSEGFGLQPMEAIACGCQVFSSLNGGLSDYLDPGFNCQKIAGHSLSFDVERILRQLQTPQPLGDAVIVADYRRDAVLKRLAIILADINLFFDHLDHQTPAPIPPLTPWRLKRLRLATFWRKLQKKLRPS